MRMRGRLVLNGSTEIRGSFGEIGGETHHMWRAFGHVGEVLEAVPIKCRDRKVALLFLRKFMKRHVRPEQTFTDILCSYGAAPVI